MKLVNKLFNDIIKEVAPPKKMTISEWADNYRYISAEGGAEVGKWSTDRAPYQREIMDSVSDPNTEKVVIMSGVQLGKALDINTPIPTPTGWTTMGCIKPGDKVFDENGNVCSVTMITPIMYNRRCYKITFSDNTNIVADENHKWLVNRKNNKCQEKGIVLHTKDMINDFEINHRNGKKESRYSIDMQKPLELDNKELLIDPYTLGVWLGDGHSYSAQITMHEDDLEIAENIKNKGHKIVVRREKGKTMNVMIDPLRLTKDTMHKRLISMNLLKNKHIPEEYYRASKNQRLELLQGIMDTDGSICKNHICEICFKSDRLVYDVSKLLTTLGIRHNIKDKKTTCTNSKNNIEYIVKRITFTVYDDMPVFKLKRKLERIKKRDLSDRRQDAVVCRYIRNIEEVESRPVRCISVDSESHLYLAGEQMVPTHNTEFLLNIVAYYIDIEPSPMMYVLPQLDLCKEFSKTRVSTMIRDTQRLADKVCEDKSRDGKNNIMMKMFPGGYFKLAGSNSEASLRSAPLRVVLLDEVDAYPKSAGSGGDPSSLADKRTSNFYNRKIVMVSSPLVKGKSRIEDEYSTSTQEEWHHVCPNCGEYVSIGLDILNFEQEEMTMTCPHCGCTANEYEWKSEVGKWIAANPSSKKRGFHITSFSSPWVTWETLKSEYIDAKRNALYMRTFINTRMGLPYDETQESNVDYEEIMDKREVYDAQVPDPVLCLTAGVDTQDDRLECEVDGWLYGEECYAIEKKVFRGNTLQNEVWNELYEYLDSNFYYGDGTPIKISCACIDSGGHRTTQVYNFCKKYEDKRIYAIKGQGGIGIPLIHTNRRTKRAGNMLFILGVDDGKSTLSSRLKMIYIAGGDNSGYYHYPMGEEGQEVRGFDKDYFKGLLSEVRVEEVTSRGTKIYYKKKPGVRNEPLDIKNYNQAAIKILNPKWESLAKRRALGKEPINSSNVRRNRRRVLSRGVR